MPTTALPSPYTRSERSPVGRGRPELAPSAILALVLLGTWLSPSAVALAAPPSDPTPAAELPEGPSVPADDGLEQPREVADFTDPFAVALAPRPGGLTSHEVAERAVASAPTVAVALADLEIAAAKVDQTIVQFLPQLRGEASYSRLNPVDINFGSGALVGTANEGPLTTGPCPPDLGLPPGSNCVVDPGGGPAFAAASDFPLPLDFWSLQASLGVPISDYVLRLLPGTRAARKAEAAAEVLAEAERLKVKVDAQVAYYNWIKALALVTVAEQSLDRSQARLTDAEIGFEAGVTSKADVMRLDATVARTEAAVVDARAFADVAAAMLATLMGEAGTPSYEIGEDVLGPVPAAAAEGSLDELVDRAWSDRLELRALGYNIEAVDQGIRATRASYYPRLTAFGELTYANPNQRFFPLTNEWNSSWVVGLSLVWVVNETIATRTKVRELRASQRRTEAQGEALRRGIRLEVTQSFKDRERARAALELNARGLASAEEAYRVAVDLYQVGSATTTDILNAELGLVNASLDDISSRIDVRIAQAKLAYATGATTRGGAAENAGSPAAAR